jgi:hypothetical protein
MAMAVKCALLFTAAPGAWAALINHELNFSPYQGELSQSTAVPSMAGRITVSVNGIPIRDELLETQQLSLGIFGDMPPPVVWLPMHVNGRFLSQRDNLVQLRFIPTDGRRPYTAWFRWHGVSDQSEKREELQSDGTMLLTSTNVVDLEEERSQLSGEFLVERSFDAPWVTPRPWQNNAPIRQLSQADELGLRALVQERRRVFETDLNAAYGEIPSDSGVDVTALKQNRCLEMAREGVRLQDADGSQIRLRTTGGPVVVAEGSNGELFPRSFTPGFGDKLSLEKVMCVTTALALALPRWMLFVKDPAGRWQSID